MFQYIIQPGDSLNSVANQFGVTVAAILAANAGLTPQFVIPGQIILIPISVPLRQNYPWYFLFPHLLNRYPRSYWDNKSHWPKNWRGGTRKEHRGGRKPGMDGGHDTDSKRV